MRPPLIRTHSSSCLKRKLMLKRLMGLAATSVLAMTMCAGGEGADAEVARHIGGFYSALVGRELRGAELRELTEQFVRLGVGDGKSLEQIRETARAFDPGTKRLQAGGPMAQTQRDWMLSENYFRKTLQGTIETRLMSEADPVRITDQRSRRVMTEGDIVALANIRDFARSNGAPQHRNLSRDEIEAAVRKLEPLVGGDNGRMPQFFHEAAAFWTGVRQEWPRLDAEQRELARAYANKTWRIRLPPEMYERLWGLPRHAVFSRQADDVTARLAEMTMINMQLGNLPILMDQIFPP
jgi:hypothetical protein